MRQDQERILISFVRVLRRISSFRCECKFCHTVIKLFTGLSWLNWWVSRSSSYLFRYRCSYIVSQMFSNVFRLSVLWFTSSWFFLRILNEFSILIFISRVLLILNRLSISNVFFVDTFFSFSKFMSSLSRNSTGWRLSSSSISLWSSMIYGISFISFLRS